MFTKQYRLLSFIVMHFETIKHWTRLVFLDFVRSVAANEFLCLLSFSLLILLTAKQCGALEEKEKKSG